MGELERDSGNLSLRCIQNLTLELNVSLSELFTFDLEEKKSEEALRREIISKLAAVKPEVLKIIHRFFTP